VTFYFYDVIFYWKQSFRGHCVPKLEFGNEGQTSAADGKGGRVTFYFYDVIFLLETKFPGSLRSQTGVWERGATRGNWERGAFGNEGQNVTQASSL